MRGTQVVQQLRLMSRGDRSSDLDLYHHRAFDYKIGEEASGDGSSEMHR